MSGRETKGGGVSGVKPVVGDLVDKQAQKETHTTDQITSLRSRLETVEGSIADLAGDTPASHR